MHGEKTQQWKAAVTDDELSAWQKTSTLNMITTVTQIFQQWRAIQSKIAIKRKDNHKGKGRIVRQRQVN